MSKQTFNNNLVGEWVDHVVLESELTIWCWRVSWPRGVGEWVDHMVLESVLTTCFWRASWPHGVGERVDHMVRSFSILHGAATRMHIRNSDLIWFDLIRFDSIRFDFRFDTIRFQNRYDMIWYMTEENPVSWLVQFTWTNLYVYLRYRSALAVNCWVIDHCLEVSCKVSQITSAKREWFIYLQLTDKQWFITQQFTH